MRIFFLSASVPLAKTYTPTTKTPYPHVRDFTSHPHDITTLDELAAHIQTHAKEGHCLLKGELLHPLHHESRAGSTHPSTPTTWACFDVDRCSPEIETPEQYIQLLPPPFHHTSYIWHWSNSAKITRTELSGHFFFLLSTAVDPKWLKRAITQLNFLPTLDGQITLSQNGLTLSYGLDPTTAQNDKLLFIADPVLDGIPDPFEERSRFELVQKDHATLDLTPQALQLQSLDTLIQTKLTALRKAAGLPARKPSYKTEGTTEYLKNPEQGIFRGPYIEARGFRYGNLNDGDSYAYYHPLTNPKYLYNFKGEPTVRLQDIDPGYWQELNHTQAPTPGHKYTIFRDRQTDTYYTLDHEITQNTYELYPVGNLQKAQDFLRLHRQEIPESTPLWDVVFEPNCDFTIDYDAQRLNTYQKTDYLKNSRPSTTTPPHFHDLIFHVVGNDHTFYTHLINWLAAIVQRRQATRTAFLLHGCTGTGKGVLFHKVLKPILGAAYCTNILMEDLDSNWNEWLETSLLVFVDEAQINDSGKGAARANKIKNLISEPTLMMKRKFSNAKQITSYTNFIFAANEHDAIALADNDRRFKIPPRQEHPIDLDNKGLQALTDELQRITDYLISYPINDEQLTEIPLSAARKHIIDSTKTPLDQFIDIINNGDLDTLAGFANELETVKNAVFRNKFLYLLQEWSHYVDQPTPIPIADLRATYNFLFNADIGAVKFGKMLANKNIKARNVRISTVVCACTTITWRTNQPELIVHTPKNKEIPCPGHTLN